MKFVCGLSPFKWRYFHVSNLELCTLHKEYVDVIRSFQFNSFLINNVNKTSGDGDILNLKKSLWNRKSTGNYKYLKELIEKLYYDVLLYNKYNIKFVKIAYYVQCNKLKSF